jgi:(2Fe-2S) ferredoxin
MSQMVFPCLSIYEDIIKEIYEKMTKKRAKDMVHEALKGGGRVTQPKGHDQKLVPHECERLS